MTFWCIVGILSGLCLMVLSGFLSYRYEMTFNNSSDPAYAVVGLLLFPIALPILAMLWLARWDERAEQLDRVRRKRIAALEHEAFGGE